MWAVFGTLAGLSWSVGNLFDKHLLTKVYKNVWHYLGIAACVNLLVGLLFVVQGDFGAMISEWEKMLIVIIMDFVAIIGYTLAMQMDEVSRVVPLFIMANIFIPLGDALFLGHVLDPDMYLSMVVIVTFGFLLIYNPKKGITHSWRVFLLMLMSTLTFTVNWLIADTIVDTVGAVTFAGTMYLFRFLWVFWIGLGVFCVKKISPLQMIKTVRPYFTFKILLMTFLSSCSGVIGISLFVKGMEGDGIPSLVEIMTFSQYIPIFFVPLFMTLFAPHHYQEDISPRVLVQKGVCLCCMIGGAIVLLL